MSEGHILFNRFFRRSRSTSFVPHLLLSSPFSLPPSSSLDVLSRRGHRSTETSRGHAERELLLLQGPHRYGELVMSEVHIYLICYLRFSRTRLILPHFILFTLSPSLPQVPSTRSCSPKACRRWTSAAAVASQVRPI